MKDTPGHSTTNNTPPLLDQVSEAICTRHYSLETTMIYTHVLNKGGKGVISPADRL